MGPRIAVKSRFEAYIYLNGQVKRLWAGDGNIRGLIEDFLVPIETLPELRTAELVLRARVCEANLEDTAVVGA